MKRSLLDILVCPLCKGDLVLTIEHESGDEIVTGSLRCAWCEESYLIEDAIPNMLPPELRD